MAGVNADLSAALRAWKGVTPHSGPNDFVVAALGGVCMTQRQVWDCNERTCKAAGIKYMSEHKLRHSYATHYLAAGGSIHDLKQNLFHSSVTTTEIYSHALKSELSRRAGVFSVESPKPKDKDTGGDQ